ncbi:DsbA family protein [Desulfovibrio inopinatus]|uniref:DsbA family protein n=1 Tax=Desulfovibrio inopinatus TaxID=102109 RepID=UPI0003FD0D5A|nr:thioredoxin domain-containing protein [Desulfovibrio inopinatus]
MKIRLWCLTLLVIVALAFPLGACAADNDLKDQIATILKENPQIILDVLRENNVKVFEIVEQGVNAKRENEVKALMAKEIKNPLKPKIDDSRPFLGKKDAPVTIVEYSSFLCGYCAKGAQSIKALLAQSPDKYRVFFKHFVLSDEAKEAARYFEAIARQDQAMAWKFHDLAFAKQAQIAQQGDEALKQIAKEAGANMDQLQKDLEDPAIDKQLTQDTNEARQFGFDGTPTYLVDGVSIRGAAPPQRFDYIVEEIAKAKK